MPKSNVVWAICMNLVYIHSVGFSQLLRKFESCDSVPIHFF